MATSDFTTPARAAGKSRLGRAHGRTTLHVSGKLNAAAWSTNDIEIKVSLGKADDLAALEDAIDAKTRDLFVQAVENYLRKRLDHEIEDLVSSYRILLREKLITGEDPKLKAALNRARLQEKILAGTPMADQAEACELLGLSGTNPSATMKRREERGELLRFTRDGRAVYPLLQFDVEGRRIFPAVGRLIELKPDTWSDFRLLHWLTRPHLDFDGAPAEALGAEGEAVILAFSREIEPVAHG